MAKHEIVIHENTGATKTMAPYLGSYVSKETVNKATFAAQLAAKCGLPAIQVRAILDGVFEQIEELEAESLVRIHLDGFTVAGVIKGTFATADAAFDPAVQKLQLALRLEEEVKNELVDVSGTIVTDDSATRVRLDNVVDVNSPRPYNVVYGQGIFRLQGVNLVTTDEGAQVYLQNSLGATFPCVIDEVVSKQLVKVHTAALLEAGDYKVVVKSRGGDAAGSLQTTYRKVKYLKIAAVGPRINKGYTQSAPTREGEYILYGDFVLEGQNLGDATGVSLKYTCDRGEVTEQLPLDACEIEADKITIHSGGFSSYIEESYNNPKPEIKVTTPEGTASYAFTSAGE